MKNKGFSFIGAITAIAIVMTALSAILTLASMSLRSAETSQSRMVASGLAQEGLEVIRNIRGSYLEWSHWDWYATTTPFVPLDTPIDYCVQYNTVSLSSLACGDPDNTPLKIRTDVEYPGFYQYGLGEDTPFYRKITMTRLSEDEVKVEVEIKWKIRGRDEWNYLKVEDRLWRWK